MLQDVVEIDTPVSPQNLERNADGSFVVAPDFGPIGDKPDATQPADGDCAAEDSLFTEQLLAALATMAVRSKRRQADLCAALSRAGLDREPNRVTRALRALEQSGCIEHLVPLYDGGVLMSVTSRGVEKLSSGPRWNLLDGSGFLRS